MEEAIFLSLPGHRTSHILGPNIRSSHLKLTDLISNHWADPLEWPSSTTDLELGYSLSLLLQSATLSGETLHVNINLTVIRVCVDRESTVD